MAGAMTRAHFTCDAEAFCFVGAITASAGPPKQSMGPIE